MGYGVIGSPTDSGSVSLGSSPGTPAPQHASQHRTAPSSRGPGRRPLKAVAPVRIRSGLPTSTTRPLTCTTEGQRPCRVSGGVRSGPALSEHLCPMPTRSAGVLGSYQGTVPGAVASRLLPRRPVMALDRGGEPRRRSGEARRKNHAAEPKRAGAGYEQLRGRQARRRLNGPDGRSTRSFGPRGGCSIRACWGPRLPAALASGCARATRRADRWGAAALLARPG